MDNPVGCNNPEGFPLPVRNGVPLLQRSYDGQTGGRYLKSTIFAQTGKFLEHFAPCVRVVARIARFGLGW